MKVLAYGEDSLTLWAIQNRLGAILGQLGDGSDVLDCRVYYRPSFGRGNRISFGEFDFIILSPKSLYLGESKWAGPSQPGRGPMPDLELRPRQEDRHAVFAIYLDVWFRQANPDWDSFRDEVKLRLAAKQLGRGVPPKYSRLKANLQMILETIRAYYVESSQPRIRNVLLYLHDGLPKSSLPRSKTENFGFVSIDYTEGKVDGSNFVSLEL